MIDRYTTRLAVFTGGERAVFTIDAATGAPEPYVTAYSALELRPGSRSYRTMLPAHRGIAMGLSSCDRMGIDVIARVKDGTFFAKREVNAVTQDMKRDRREGTPKSEATPLKPSSSEREIRAFADFVGNLGSHVQTAMPMGPDRNAYVRRCDDCVQSIKARAIRGRSGGKREGHDERQLQALVGVLDTPTADGPWASDFVTFRNWAFVISSLMLGWREGEFLAWRKRDVDLAKRMCWVKRRPDAPDDPRLRIPAVKTLGRELALPEVVADAIRRLFDHERAHLPQAWASPWVFTAANGRPLSPAAVAKLFADVKRKWPAVGPELSCHKLRHTWNEIFSDACDQAGLTAEEEVRVRMLQMGWANPASAACYLKRTIRRQARDVGLIVQRRFLEARGLRDA